MNCEEYAAVAWGAEHDSAFTPAQAIDAREHLSVCSACAALAESWNAARSELRDLADITSVDGAPARVEMRLRQEFRTRHRTMKTRRVGMVAAWGLAAAALVVGAVNWSNWHSTHITPKPDAVTNVAAQASPSSDSTLVADNGENEFTALPGAIYAGNDDAEVVRVRMQRGSLGALGFPVNEDRASEWIQVDLLVGNDGLPQAVRVAE
jgi:hypothetical protein